MEFIDWRYSQSWWYFLPSFVNYCPSNLLSGSPPHPSIIFKVKVQYIQTVYGWEGVEGRGCFVVLETKPYSAFKNRFLTRFRTYKIAAPPLTKTYRRGGSLRQTPAAKSLYRSIF
jgi:hypothetical protein